MKHFWMGVTLICLIVAAASLWQQHYDAAFVVGTIGALAWFLNYRARVKQVLAEELAEEDEQDDKDEESN